MTSVTVLIPTYNEEKNIASVVEGLLCEKDSLEQLEIFVIDGGAQDRTKDIVRVLELKYPAIVRLIENPRRIQAAALNIGIDKARGDVIVRCDAHARYERGYIKACLDVLEESGADVAGGAQIAIGETYFQEIVSIAYNSFLGSGRAKYRNPNYSGFVDTVWMGAYRKEVFSDGLRFDESIPRDEDYEFFLQLHSKGKKIYLSARIRGYYLPRDAPSKLAKQFFINGRDVSLTVKKNFKRIIGRPLIMLCAVTFLLTISIAACFSFTALCILGVITIGYCLILFLQTLFYVGKKPMRYLFPLPIVLAVMHFSYSTGLFFGCLRELILRIIKPVRVRT